VRGGWEGFTRRSRPVFRFRACNTHSDKRTRNASGKKNAQKDNGGFQIFFHGIRR